MGTYDTFGAIGVQLKAGPCKCRQFDVGDSVDIDDGVYVGYEGIVAIKGGAVVMVTDLFYDKWGGEISCKALLDERNPVASTAQHVLREARNSGVNR